MTDAAVDTSANGQPTTEQPAVAADALAAPAPASSPSTVDPHPERVVGAAFAGGLALALILKRLAR